MFCEFETPSIIYYSYLPPIIISVVLGFFVLLSNRRSLVNQNLFIIIFIYCVWSIGDFILWLTFNVPLTLFIGRLLILEVLKVLFFLFFCFSLIGKKLNLKSMLLLCVPFVPFLILLPTDYNVYILDATGCDTQTGSLYFYYYAIQIIYVIASILLILLYYKKSSTKDLRKKQIKITVGAIVFYFFWFISIQGLSVLLRFYNPNLADEIALLMPFGMVILITMLVYAITKYQFLGIKVIAAGVMVLATWAIIFSQFFIVQELSNQILTGITLALTTVFGYMLFRSIKEEVKVSAELAASSRKLSSLNNKLEELDRAKSEFISIASHQLRTPLTSVKGFTSLILDNTFGKVPDKQKTAVEKVFVNNEKLVLLVEDMLNASRLEAGRLEYEFEEADIVSVVTATIETIKLYAKSKGIKLIYSPPKITRSTSPRNGASLRVTSFIVLIDQRKVSEIIANLIDNAIKYTPKGSVTVTLGQFHRDEKIGEFKNTLNTSNDWVRISVKDTGIGMAKHQLQTIFEKFKGGSNEVMSNTVRTPPVPPFAKGGTTSPQLRGGKGTIFSPSDKGESPVKRGEGVDAEGNASQESNGNGDSNAGGTGLGVYISRQMAIAMKGRLYATSPGKNKGSTFILELPLVKK